MDFAKLSSNEKLAVYGSVAAIVGGVIGGNVSALGWLAFLAALAMLAVVFLPQFSPSTTLPGSKGSLMLICGAVAGIILVLGLLSVIGVLGSYFEVLPLNAIFFLIAVVGGVVMAWAGWQEFQAEGGKFQLGTGGAGAGTTPPAAAPPPAGPTTTETAPPPTSPPPAAPPPASPPPASTPSEPMAPPMSGEGTSTPSQPTRPPEDEDRA